MSELKTSSPINTRSSGLNYSEIKSHSSLLTNERLGVLFYSLDMASITLNKSFNPEAVVETKAILFQVWKNIRPLVRYNWAVRNTLKLETKEEGVYTIDVAFDIMEKMNLYCQMYGFTYKRIYLMRNQLNHIEIIMRDVLQFFNYSFRPEFKQKPDIEFATEKYKQMADDLTIEQLKQVIGKNHKIDFENLGVLAQSKENKEDKEDDEDK
jgi:hypothetical protein